MKEIVGAQYEDLWQIFKLIRKTRETEWLKYCRLRAFHDEIDKKYGERMKGKAFADYFQVLNKFLSIRRGITIRAKTDNITAGAFKNGFDEKHELEEARKSAQDWWNKTFFDEHQKAKIILGARPTLMKYGRNRHLPKDELGIIFEETNEEAYMARYKGDGEYELFKAEMSHTTKHWKNGQTFKEKIPNYVIFWN